MTSSSEDEDYLYRSLTFRSVLVCKSKTIPEETAILDISTAIVNIIAILPAILGNILILLAIRKTSSIAMPTKVLLGSLAFTDLGVGLLAQPLYAVKTLSSDVLTRCVSGVLFDILSGHLSITSFFSVMFISLDRFMALHLKLRYRTVGNPKTLPFYRSTCSISCPSMGFNLHLDAQSLFSSHTDNFTHLLGNLFLVVYQNLPHSSPKTKVLQNSSATQVFETSRRPHSLAVP